jgi:hypothetical protein
VSELIGSLVLHLVLGIAVALAVWVWGLGLGCWLLLWRKGGVSTQYVAFAYPLGLLALFGGAFSVLVEPWLAVVVALAAAAPLVALARARRSVASLARACRGAFLYALPGTIGLPLALGLLLHGPTEQLDSNAYGDMVFYAAKLVSATDSVLPFRDLTVEGEPSAYVEAGASFLGAALACLPGLDPVLFQTTTLPAFALSAIAIGVGLSPCGTGPAVRFLPVAGLLAATLVAYPTWLTESPPVALALPLGFSLYALVSGPVPLPLLTLVSAVVVLDFVLTKGFGALLVAVFAGWAFARDHARGLDGRALLLLGGSAAALAGVVLVLFLVTSGWLTERFAFSFRPDDAVGGLIDQLDVRTTVRAGPGVELLGLLVLFAALVRMRAWPFVVCLAVALAGHELVGGHGFDILVGLSILPSALLWRARPELVAEHRALAVSAAALLALSAWFRDTSAVRAGLVFVVLLALATVGAFAERRARAFSPAAAAALLLALAGRSLVAFVVLLGLAAIAALAPALHRVAAPVALAAAAVIAATSELHLTTNPSTLTHEDYAMWSRVADAVPKDGLVFTSLTGPLISGEQGWNYYPGVARRQIWLAGWSNSVLLVDQDERARRLRLNEEVVSGRRSPDSVPLERAYSSYFAVLRAAAPAPSGWRRLYGNDDLVLYRIR